MKRAVALVVGLLSAASVVRAQDPSSLPEYVAQRQVAGVIRISGHGAYGKDFIGKLVNAWEDGFRRIQPGVTFRNHLVGTASAIGALYAGTDDLALMGREIWPMELSAFDEVFHYPPLGIDVVTGSYNVRNKDFALVAFVNKENPLSRIDFAQLDGIFDAEHRRTAMPIRTWGQLGLTGEWADKPIHPVGFPVSRGFSYYMEQTVFAGSRKWVCDMKQFPDVHLENGKLFDGGQQILDAIAEDKYAIGYSSMYYSNSGAKPLAIARTAAGPYVAASPRTVEDHSYPLTRVITIYLNRRPGTAVAPRLREFLLYVLSRQGQAATAADGGYLPLTPKLAAEQRKKLQ